MDTFRVTKSYKDGHVGVRVSMKTSGWHGASIKIEGAADLGSAQARELAKALVEEADRADAKVATKKASDDRRQKWRERDIAAGRMQVMSLHDLARR